MPGFSVPAAYYAASVVDFVGETTEQILGTLTSRSPFSVELPQRDAWIAEISILKEALEGAAGTVFLEFDVPRIGSRIDAVLIADSAVFVIEFKVGERSIHTHHVNQVWDYALDLKNFHLSSHGASILPVLVPTDSDDLTVEITDPADDLVYRPIACSAGQLGQTLRLGQSRVTGEPLDPLAWAQAPYRPTPTIIEAAQALYAQHSVDNIARHDAGAKNLAATSQCVEDIIERARTVSQKAIVFVTGVPGAGKTLVGLNVATKKREDSPTHAVFLSGNGPLVKVLREALARDEMARQRIDSPRLRKGTVQQKIKAFIQNVHHFRDEGLNQEAPPHDRVVIFDEAQRAWDQKMTADFMRRKKGRPGFSQSEPEFLLSYLNRHDDWAVVVCLVGGGQEINRGEAGISAWLRAVSDHYPGWCAYISPNLTDSEYDAGHALESLGAGTTVVSDDRLHLSASMRSFRAEDVSRFVKAVLDREGSEARGLLDRVSKRYPIALTRDLSRAKAWIRAHSRASERFGLMASSGAQRLKAHGVDVRIAVDPVHWFLNDRTDTRSSFYLEDAATEFQVQGLELDWACIAWDADFRYEAADWSCHSFVGSKWNRMKNVARRSYLRNSYRVLLTRARQGMVICVPYGNPSDPTRLPQFYDETFDYLQGVGLTVV